ncbi:MAG: lytic murein transglycosylase [Desulfobacteraceae bacterium]|nr:lytic murein transglycosylase [Desulfobacteraceae bacterium]
MKSVFLYSCLILTLTLQANLAFSNKNNTDHIFTDLTKQLVKDGFNKEKLDRLYSNKDIFFDSTGISLFFVHSEASLDYDQFVSESSLKNAFIYMDKHKNDLKEAENKYGVDKTIITAILLVETRLGKYLGSRLVINTLSTMASLTDNNLRKKLYKAIPVSKPGAKRISKIKFEKKSQYKAKWAYIELKALLKYSAREKLDPSKITGSYAGALGLSQFLPSNALRLARDGNKDGKIDLFQHPDAIYSIANFLKHYGWNPTISRQKAHKVLYKYNHSKPYVNTLLKISDQLKGLNFI